jgi:hypothetical protein
MEALLDDIARTTKQDPVAYRMRLFGDKHPRHRAALQLAVDKSGYGKKQLPAGRAWGVAVHESFDSVVAYVVEASVQDGKPVLNRVTSGVHCNLAVNPRGVEAQVQGAAVMGLSMCLPGAAITLKDGEVQQSNFGDFTVPRITDMPEIASCPPAWVNPAYRRWRRLSRTQLRGSRESLCASCLSRWHERGSGLAMIAPAARLARSAPFTHPFRRNRSFIRRLCRPAPRSRDDACSRPHAHSARRSRHRRHR